PRDMSTTYRPGRPDHPTANDANDANDAMALVPFSQPRTSHKPAGYSSLFGNVSMLDRLDDFRKGIIRSFIAVAIGIVIGFSFVDRVVSFILQPTRRALPSGTTLIYTQPGEAFSLYIQIALIVGVV